MFNENGKSWFTGTQAALGYDTRCREPKIKKLQLNIVCSAEHVGSCVCAEFLDSVR